METLVMSRDLNKCMFIGRLGKDPELRHMQSGGAVVNFSIACSADYKEKKSGKNVEKTEWINIVAFNLLAEIAGEYLKKGSKVYIEGSLRTRKWQGNDGQDRYTTEIVAGEMQMLDSRGSGGGAELSRSAPASQDDSHGDSAPKAADDFEDSNIPF